MTKMFEVKTWKPSENIAHFSGPFKTREAAERALVALFQSGQAMEGTIQEVEVVEAAP